MANTFITLNDTPSSYTGQGAKYLQVDGNEGNVIFNEIALSNLADTYLPAPAGGQVLRYSSGSGKWRAETYAPYSAGNGISLGGTGFVINAVAGSGGGLEANTNGIYISDVATAGVYGNATHIPEITINSKGQVTSVTLNEATVLEAQGLNADYVGNVVGTTGQITVSGGVGKNSNATLNLVATGVTSGVYGNTTHIPQITVDTYGRIQNVDMVNVTGNVSGGSGGNVSLAYKNIAVSGQTTLSADEAEDTLTFEGGTGFDWTTTPSEDKITVSANATALSGILSLSGLSDVDASGITNGQVLIWNSSTSQFEAGDQTGSGGGSNVTLTDFTVTTATPSGNGSLTYNNAGVFTFTPADTSSGGIDTAGVDTHLNTSSAGSNEVLSWNGSDYVWVAQTGGSTQSLSWESSNNTLSISGGNTVDLSAVSQTLSISGNVITISGSSDTVDLTSALGNVAGNYGDSNVASYLSTNGYSNVDNDAQTLSLSANILTISGSNSTVDVGKTRFYYANQTDFPNATTYHGAIAHSHADAAMYFAHGGSWNKLANDSDLSSYQTIVASTTANTNMQAYVDALETRIIGGANVSLDSLAEVANALANSNTELSTVAFTGTYSDLQSRPTIGLSGSDLTYDGTTLDLSGVGAQGPQGNAGVDGTDGVSVTNATISSDNLVLTLSNASTIDAGNVRGPVGPQGSTGPQGDGNAGISSATITAGNLVLTLNDSTTIDAGNVKGDTGDTGATGVGITSTTIVGDNLTIAYSNTSTQDVGNIRGPIGATGLTGATGPQGVSVSSAALSGANLVLTLSDASTIDAGNVKGDKGDTGAQGPAGNVLVTTANAAPSGASEGQMWYATDDGHTYIYYNNAWVQANPGQDPQTLTLAGNVLTISGSNSNVDFTTILGAVDTDTDAQDLSITGNVISLTGQTGNVDLTSLLGAYINTDSQTLSVNNSSNVVTISGGNTIDLSDVLANASGATSLLTLTDVGSDGTNGQVLTTDGAGSFTFTTVSGGGGIANLNSNVISDLGDVSSTTPTSGQVLKWNGSSWAPAADSTGSGGGSGATVERFKINYNSSGAINTISDSTSGITSINIDSASSGDITINFDSSSYNYPPASVLMYGYDYTNNKYNIVPLETTMTVREIAGGGTSGSPTLFNGASAVSVSVRMSENETGASKGSGFPPSPTHAWVQVTMYD